VPASSLIVSVQTMTVMQTSTVAVPYPVTVIGNVDASISLSVSLATITQASTVVETIMLDGSTITINSIVPGPTSTVGVASSTDMDESGDGKLSRGTKTAAIVAGVVGALLICCLLVVYFHRRHRWRTAMQIKTHDLPPPPYQPTNSSQSRAGSLRRALWARARSLIARRQDPMRHRTPYQNMAQIPNSSAGTDTFERHLRQIGIAPPPPARLNERAFVRKQLPLVSHPIATFEDIERSMAARRDTPMPPLPLQIRHQGALAKLEGHSRGSDVGPRRATRQDMSGQLSRHTWKT
jgi:hypothetical protein